MANGIILSLGSVNADFQVRVDQQPGSTTTMLAHDFVRLSGGKAANVAYLAQRLGIPASLIARVGDDILKEQALRPLQDAGIDLTFVRVAENTSTGVSMIAVPPGGKKHIILAANANDVWKQADRNEIQLAVRQAPPGSVLVTDYEVSPFIVEQAIIAARERNFPIILDPSPTDRVDQQLLSKINYIVPDASETEELTGIIPDSVDNAVSAARELIDRGVEVACIKLSEGGCVVAKHKTTLHVPPVAVEVSDTTGAGDAFAGALAVAVLEQRTLPEAACFATAASLAATTGYGSQPAYPSRERIQHLFDQVRANIQTIDKS